MSETTQEVVEPETGDQPDEPAELDTEPDAPFEEPEPDEPVQQPEAVAAVAPADDTDPRILDSQKKWNNFEKAVRTIWGDYASNLMECPLCFTSHKGLIDLNDRGQYPEEVLAAIIEYARGAEQVQYRDATQVRQCPDCSGWGKVLSGSRLASHETVTCPSCKGYGYVPPPVPSSSGNGYAEAAQVQGAGVGASPEDTEPPADADIWGSPRLLPDGQENPNYGKMPQYKNASLP